MLLDKSGELFPEFDVHVRRVNYGIEGVGVYRISEFLELRYLFQYLGEIKGAQVEGYGILFHSDGASGVDQEYGSLVSHVVSLLF